MRIPFLGQPASDTPVPLWRHPEVCLLDWIFQLLLPLVLPLAKMVRAALVGDLGMLNRVRKSMDKNDGSQHDGIFEKWALTRLELPRADGTVLEVLLHRPPHCSTDANLPLILWFHGGGYTVGCARDSFGATLATELLRTAGGSSIFAWASVEYRLAPEHPFPAAPLDGASALDYFTSDVTRSSFLGIDAAQVHVAGTSAGAGLAACIVSDATRRGIAVRSLLLEEPMLDPRTNSASYISNGAATIAPASWLRWSWEVYYHGAPAGTSNGSASARFVMSPRLLDADVLLSSHPQTIVVTASADNLRDEGAAYAEALRKIGRLAVHIEAKGSHVVGINIDRKARGQMFDAWAALLSR